MKGFREDAVSLHDGVWFHNHSEVLSGFEKEYFAVREKENRMLSDDDVKQLPNHKSTQALEREWNMRAHSYQWFYNQLAQLEKPLSVLEVGCGNGWIVAGLAALSNVKSIVGLDKNAIELWQAARCFSADKITWLYGDVFSDLIIPQSFDVIYLAAAVQYFPDLTALVEKLRTLLKPDGVIYLWDSPFYDEKDRAGAAQRSKAYYEKMGAPEMASFYFHHSKKELLSLGAERLDETVSMMNRLLLSFRGKGRSPFSWWKIPK
jgi:SAM-dependent methyltransferase